mmetsp:Transcript_19823/g.35247  ORF Transcript_19823/g.35247 Transcript_19823/m.35247 type:complete len:90 (+) Transcript_19823:237-506(+)|eukprot:CAMPEP_0184508832 /NCGR_PEP_ID=MMETSP0198_2-20121128/965_1 /TAXON_ID=1112570 /ORGANISM="Thraustochytrium sp., Strain LLF1b" /LENGTH=89 /DNA_ID=CAMNT_0026898631 /DNA_START=231 /DNA_END=500 /DNA_ORIENTATION=+
MAPGPMAEKAMPALRAWWGKYQYTSGLVTRTVSPYRQDLLTHWVKQWPAKMKHKVADNFWDVVPPFLTLVGVVTWGDATFEREMRKHRD